LVSILSFMAITRPFLLGTMSRAPPLLVIPFELVGDVVAY